MSVSIAFTADNEVNTRLEEIAALNYMSKGAVLRQLIMGKLYVGDREFKPDTPDEPQWPLALVAIDASGFSQHYVRDTEDYDQ